MGISVAFSYVLSYHKASFGFSFVRLHQVEFAFAAGLVVIAAMIPLNAALAKRIGVATRDLMGHKDDRVQRCSEMLQGIRVSQAQPWTQTLPWRKESESHQTHNSTGGRF